MAKRKSTQDLDAAFDAAPAPVAAQAFKPSRYQQGIFDWIKDGKGNAVVEAVAGSGKTTTIVQALSLMKGNVLFTAFNKHIQTELSSRAPAGVRVSTIHSLGMATIRKNGRSVEIDDRKARRLVAEIVGDESRATLQKRNAIETLVRLTKLTLTDGTDQAALASLVDHYGIDTNGDHDEIVESVAPVLRMMLDECAGGMIDFDDMIWYPAHDGLRPDQYDWVCVDEAQDLNAAQRKLVLAACRGRVIAVGDRHQSIYGFTGADTNSIPTLVNALSATVLPLSICYRCPSSHVALAKEIVPQIEARENAPVGTVQDVSWGDAVKTMVSGDLVICRINKPLADVAMSLIRAGKKAVVRGKDIGNGLVGLVEKHRAGSLGDTLAKITTYRDREVSKLIAAKKENRAASLQDRVETIITLSDGMDTVDALKSRIQGIFSDDVQGVVCSSVHKAKGLEANRVFVTCPQLMPFPKAKQGWEIEQEMNLKYVALTRAKADLYMVADK
jgi:DNA helicase II / ATP-dependent DNA helicase PcrA